MTRDLLYDLTYLQKAIDWASSCGNVAEGRKVGSCFNTPSNCCPCFPTLYAYEDARWYQALLGAGANFLVALYALLLNIFTIPFLFFGSLLGACGYFFEPIKLVADELWNTGQLLAYALGQSFFNIIATLTAHCSEDRARKPPIRSFA